jgi:hypothetical protein
MRVKRPCRLIVVGFGPHFRERYYPVLEQNACEIALAIDMQSERSTIMTFLHGRKLIPNNFTFLPEDARNTISEMRIAAEIGSVMPGLAGVTGVLICTEPKVHKPYALWAMRQGLDVFVDKPLTAFGVPGAATGLYRDFCDLAATQKLSDVNVVVSCERRMQIGYRFVFEFLTDFINTHRVPITAIDIHFAGGKWVTPEEYVTMENHPYKYGYGVLLHSGYHFVDLLAQLCDLNRSICDIDFDFLRLSAFARRPAQLLSSPVRVRNPSNLNEKQNLLRTEAERLGEIDVVAIGEVGNAERPVTLFGLKLLDTSASNRDNWQSLQNPYLEGGRIRQEQVIVHVGHLCSLIVSSDAAPPQDDCVSENFSITIHRNTAVAGGNRVRRIRRIDLSENGGIAKREILNVKARQDQLLSFMEGDNGNSPLCSHRDTARLLDALFERIQFSYSPLSN